MRLYRTFRSLFMKVWAEGHVISLLMMFSEHRHTSIIIRFIITDQRTVWFLQKSLVLRLWVLFFTCFLDNSGLVFCIHRPCCNVTHISDWNEIFRERERERECGAGLDFTPGEMIGWWNDVSVWLVDDIRRKGKSFQRSWIFTFWVLWNSADQQRLHSKNLKTLNSFKKEKHCNICWSSQNVILKTGCVCVFVCGCFLLLFVWEFEDQM